MSIELVIMLVMFAGLMLAGFPLSFSMLFCALVYLWLTGQIFYLIVHNLFTGIDIFTLMAIPFFILAGELMVYSGTAERMLAFTNVFVGRFRGGLAYVNVFTSMLFGGCSGSAIADVAGLGPLEIRMMEKGGYSREFATAVTVSSAVQGPMIPPSIPLVLVGAVTGTSIGGLLLGGAIPGALVGLGQAITVYFVCRRRQVETGVRLTLPLILVVAAQAIPFLMMPFIIVGGIVSGIFTPTEASAAAAAYGFVLMLAYRKGRIDLPALGRVFIRSAVLTGAILMLAGASNVFGWILAAEQVPAMITRLMLDVTDNPYLFLLIVNGFLLLWGMVMDSLPAILIILPLLFPVAKEFGIDPIHFGVVATLNLVIGLITPPYGAALFTGSIVSGLPIERIVRHMIPFTLASIVVLLLITYVPATVMYLPTLFNLHL